MRTKLEVLLKTRYLTTSEIFAILELVDAVEAATNANAADDALDDLDRAYDNLRAVVE